MWEHKFIETRSFLYYHSIQMEKEWENDCI